MFHKIADNKTIEVYYMNNDNCKNYNDFNGFRETDHNYVRVGYYYDNMIGPFFTEKSAVQHARENFSKV